MYHKMLMAYDGSREGQAALQEGAEIAVACHAETHLLAVMRKPPDIALVDGVVPEEYFRDEYTHAQEVLREGVEQLRARSLATEGHLTTGDPPVEIAKFARDLGADLIVVGHRSRSRLARWWGGSVGASLLDLAPCSILVVISHAPAGETA